MAEQRDERNRRLAEALRANLRKRKAGQKADPDQRPRNDTGSPPR